MSSLHGFTSIRDIAMSGSARALAWSFAGVVSLLTCRVEADDVQEGVDRYPSGDARVTLEWFAPAARGKYPVILILHGSGGLDPGGAHVFRIIGREFAAWGYVVLIPHYFERTNHTIGKPLQPKEFQEFAGAVEDAIKFAVASGVADEDRIGIIGHSMGAHFAFSRAVKDPRVKAIVSCAGSLPVGSRSKFPPVLILQGSKDRGNPLDRVKAFQEELKAKGTPSANRIYKGMGHNFDLDTWEDAAGRAAAFFDKHLRNPGNARSKAARRGRPRKDADRVTTPRKDDDGLDRGADPRKDDDEGPHTGRPVREGEGAGGSEPGSAGGSRFPDRSGAISPRSPTAPALAG